MTILRKIITLLALVFTATALTVVGAGAANAADPQFCSASKADPGAHYTLQVCLVVGTTAVSGTTKLFYDAGVAGGSTIAVTLCRDGRCVGQTCPVTDKPAGTHGVEQCTDYVARLSGHHTYQAYGIDNYTGVRVGPVTATT